MRAELFHADRQTNVTKLIVPFRNFAKAPKSSFIIKKKSCTSLAKSEVLEVVIQCFKTVELNIFFYPDVPSNLWPLSVEMYDVISQNTVNFIYNSRFQVLET